MPRRIAIVWLLGCVGCAGPGSPLPEPAVTTPLPGEPAVERVAAQHSLPRNGLVARTASFRPDAENELMVETIEDLTGRAIDSEIDRALGVTAQEITEIPQPVVDAVPVLNLNLPTALAMVGGQHPAVGFAQWRVQEAYAQLSQARVLWLPSLRAGIGFHRHDGNYQASNGEIVDVNRNSFQYGLGVGATGAGTTQRPGLLAEFQVADAVFLPKVASATAAARCFGSTAVVNEQLQTAAVDYLELLGAHQHSRLIEETRTRTTELSKLTSDFAATGQGLQADADRMATELTLVNNRLLAAREQVDVAAARLTQTLSTDSATQLVPADVTVLPIELVSMTSDKPSLIQTGLANRPELRESQALVQAACEQYRREKFAPFVPSVLLGFSTGGFGGGLGNDLEDIEGRYDFDALVSWEVRNLGMGEHAIRREAAAQIQQAKFEKIRVMDQVAREVAEAYSQVQHRSEQIRVTQDAIRTAQSSYERNLSRIRDGQGLPLEALQSLRALEEAQRAYLEAVVAHNQAQFRLQWALGWPVSAPASRPVDSDNSI